MRVFRSLRGLRGLKWGEWFYTLLSAAISSAASTVLANPIALATGTQQFTVRQLGILASGAAVVAIAGILKKSPLPDRAVQIALLPTVHTREQVKQVMRATSPGTVPTPADAAEIIAKAKEGDK